jgi:hypothetical protein
MIRKMRLSKAVIIGYVTSLAGTALWLYGYFEAGHQALIDWHTYTPWWISDFLPNVESEIGMVLVFVSMVPMYWPSGWKSASHDSGTSMVSEG